MSFHCHVMSGNSELHPGHISFFLAFSLIRMASRDDREGNFWQDLIARDLNSVYLAVHLFVFLFIWIAGVKSVTMLASACLIIRPMPAKLIDVPRTWHNAGHGPTSRLVEFNCLSLVSWILYKDDMVSNPHLNRCLIPGHGSLSSRIINTLFSR